MWLWCGLRRGPRRLVSIVCLFAQRGMGRETIVSFALVDCGGLLVRDGDVGAMLKLDEFLGAKSSTLAPL